MPEAFWLPRPRAFRSLWRFARLLVSGCDRAGGSRRILSSFDSTPQAHLRRPCRIRQIQAPAEPGCRSIGLLVLKRFTGGAVPAVTQSVIGRIDNRTAGCQPLLRGSLRGVFGCCRPRRPNNGLTAPGSETAAVLTRPDPAQDTRGSHEKTPRSGPCSCTPPPGCGLWSWSATCG